MVDIDKVYQKVLAIANKEQRGYITPQEFNLFAGQAQMEIFEQYFYDLDQFKRAPGSDGYGSPADFIEQKIAPFIKYDKVVSSFNQWGDIDIATNFPDFYKLVMVRVDYKLSSGFAKASKIELSELTQYAAPLTSTSTSRHKRPGVFMMQFPKYTMYFGGMGRNVKIYPHPKTEDNHRALITYVKVPKKPNWTYVVSGGGSALFNPSAQDYQTFELHPSEENNLVAKILQLSGINFKDYNLAQAAVQKEISEVQQQKQ
jgi:hypothetical protein